MTIFTTSKTISNTENMILKPMGALTFCQMNRFRLAISLLYKFNCDKILQCGVVH